MNVRRTSSINFHLKRLIWFCLVHFKLFFNGITLLLLLLDYDLINKSSSQCHSSHVICCVCVFCSILFVMNLLSSCLTLEQAGLSSTFLAMMSSSLRRSNTKRQNSCKHSFQVTSW